MRFNRIVAIAHRDLRAEFAGRRFGLLGIIALLMAPAIAIRVPEDATIDVQGQVPERVLAIPEVQKTNTGLGFAKQNGTLRVYGFFMPPSVRKALDAGDPVIEVEVVRAPYRRPKRSLYFSLIAASTLTGSVSASIGGERTRHTLQALLSAAVSRLEIVLGKWIAWTAFGTTTAFAAGFGAIAWGTQEPGPWLLALPFVPALTVAFGLWLVRRTQDVIAGTSVSLRVLPAILGGAVLVSLLTSSRSDVLAALVPLGGTMLAAGDFWDDSVPLTLLACLSSAGTTFGLLWATAADLEESSMPRAKPPWIQSIQDGAITSMTWWTLILGPVMWGWAGNAAATEALPVAGGMRAIAAMLAVFVTIAWSRRGAPHFSTPSWRSLPTALLVMAASFAPVISFENPWANRSAMRLAQAASPGLWMLPLIVIQEIWFRAYLQRGGWALGAVLWTIAVYPTQPLAGLVSGLALGACARTGVTDAILARILAAIGLYGVSLTIP